MELINKYNDILLLKNEVFVDVPGYEGFYMISNLSRIKSLKRIVRNKHGFKQTREKILKQHLIRQGYYQVALKGKSFRVQVLLAMAFMNHKPCGHKIVVDHINNIKTDNRLENLQLITARENVSKDIKNSTSKYTGVCWNKKDKRWVASIKIRNKSVHLGYFKDEYDAHLAYQKALKKLKNELSNSSKQSKKSNTSKDK